MCCLVADYLCEECMSGAKCMSGVSLSSGVCHDCTSSHAQAFLGSALRRFGEPDGELNSLGRVIRYVPVASPSGNL